MVRERESWKILERITHKSELSRSPEKGLYRFAQLRPENQLHFHSELRFSSRFGSFSPGKSEKIASLPWQVEA